MKTDPEYITEPCSQEISNLLEIEFLRLVEATGLSGFEIYELMADGQIG